MSKGTKTYTIEEVNSYRAEVYRILISWGETEHFARAVSSQPNICEVMPFNSPEEYAELMCM